MVEPRRSQNSGGTGTVGSLVRGLSRVFGSLLWYNIAVFAMVQHSYAKEFHMNDLYLIDALQLIDALADESSTLTIDGMMLTCADAMDYLLDALA